MMKFITSENALKENARERITARVPYDVYTTIHKAAELCGTTVNSFMVQVTLQYAKDLIDEEKMRSIKVIDEAEATWFLSQFEEQFRPNSKMEEALRLYNKAINDTESTNQDS